MNGLSWALSLPHQGVAGLRQRRRHCWPELPRPALSVGNLAFGGRGKTPLTAVIVQEAQELGLRPAILTRGYKGKGGRDGVPLVLKGSEGAPWLQPVASQRSTAGDEACWLAARCPGVPVAVHPDRLRAANQVLEQEDVDLFVLDDGFQTPVQRDLDLVLLDAQLDPPYTAASSPLREGPAALARASFIGVFNAPTLSGDTDPIKLEGLPCFALHRSLAAIRRLSDGAVLPPEQWPQEVLVAAAVGQPDSVRAVLAQGNIHTADSLALRDHIPPGPRQLERLRSSRLPVLVTEKDAVGWANQCLTEALVLELRIEGAAVLARRLLQDLGS